MRCTLAIIALALLAGLTGCGGAATHAHEVMTFPDGRRLVADYWIAGGHVLADPELSDVTRNPDGSWTVRGFKSATDNAGLSSVVSGLVEGVGRFFAPH